MPALARAWTERADKDTSMRIPLEPTDQQTPNGRVINRRTREGMKQPPRIAAVCDPVQKIEGDFRRTWCRGSL